MGLFPICFSLGVALTNDYFLLQIEFSENMSQEKVLAGASSSHSEGRSGRVPTGNGLVAPAPRFKPRKVPVVRDFPPGCGRVAAPITKPNEQATND
ncbi:hypothetical protein J1N35_011253 [Gossypium stocksii]|uniref:Uncharacterized protein n=1 Tax=Gossypium stocksii TaxID=47602 RepID=A0A9D3W435_9ROSI|nr:hypothetical protein J1N35_011253 [Gossypium stocksii]